jgi:small-conductance mechanosensitive channel
MSNPTFESIDAAWATIQSAFPAAYASATTEEKPKVQAVRDLARNAWYSALNRLFHEQDQLVKDLTDDLDKETARMNADLDALKQASRFLDLAKSAAKTAAALATLAG